MFVKVEMMSSINHTNTVCVDDMKIDDLANLYLQNLRMLYGYVEVGFIGTRRFTFNCRTFEQSNITYFYRMTINP